MWIPGKCTHHAPRTTKMTSLMKVISHLTKMISSLTKMISSLISSLLRVSARLYFSLRFLNRDGSRRIRISGSSWTLWIVSTVMLHWRIIETQCSRRLDKVILLLSAVDHRGLICESASNEQRTSCIQLHDPYRHKYISFRVSTQYLLY
jgi:hypothetical protein